MFCGSAFSRPAFSLTAVLPSGLPDATDANAATRRAADRRLTALCLLALLSLSTVSTRAFAEQDLQAAIAAYWLRHPDAQALAARTQAADAGLVEARSWFAGAPTVSLSRLDEQHDGGSETELEIALPLAGSRAPRQQQANAEQLALQAEIRALRLSLGAELLQLDGNRRLRDAQLSLSRERLQLSQALTANVASRVRAGELANTDLLLATSETLAAETALLSAEQAAAEAGSAWQLRVGQLPALISADRAPATGEISDHPELQLALARAQAAAARMRYTERRSNDVELSLLLKREDDPEFAQPVDSAGVKFSVPLFAGSRRDAEYTRAQAERSQADADAQRLQQQLTVEQQQARTLWQRVQQQQLLIAQQLQLTEQGWRFAEAAFAAGELPLADLLRQQQRLFDTRERVAEQQQQQREALARLILAEGQLP